MKVIFNCCLNGDALLLNNDKSKKWSPTNRFQLVKKSVLKKENDGANLVPGWEYNHKLSEKAICALPFILLNGTIAVECDVNKIWKWNMEWSEEGWKNPKACEMRLTHMIFQDDEIDPDLQWEGDSSNNYQNDDDENYEINEKDIIKNGAIDIDTLGRYVTHPHAPNFADIADFYSLYLTNVRVRSNPGLSINSLASKFYNEDSTMFYDRLTRAPQNMCYAYEFDEKEKLWEKCVVISIRPEWLYKICIGAKTIEYRTKVVSDLSSLAEDYLVK